jgi:hypothetical protein
MNKLLRIIGISIIFLIFVKPILTIEGSSDDYVFRGSIGEIAANTSSDDISYARFFSESFITNDTTGGIIITSALLENNLPPSQPILNLPLDEAYSLTNVVELSWYNATDPNAQTDFDTVTYLLEVFNDSLLTEIYYRNDSIPELNSPTSHNLTVSEEITLYWRVLATDNSGLNSSFSETRETGTDLTAPTTFNLLTPANGTSTTDNTPSLSWTSSTETNLDNYTVELSTSSNYIIPNYTEKATSTTFSNWSTQLPADTYFWKVVAYDKASRSNESVEQFALTIAAISETVTQIVSSGESVSRTGGTVKKPFNLDIISPPAVTIYSNDSVIVPLVITNPANEITLRGISLETTDESEDVTSLLGTTYIPQLRPKEQRTVPLTIVTHTDPGTYGITLKASIKSPKFTDSVKIYANLIEKDSSSQSKSSKQLIFAQEMFNGNPACLELNEYLEQAQTELNKRNYDKALNLANNAVQSCKDLIAFQSQPKTETIETYLQKAKLNKTVLILVGESAAFILVLLIAVKIIRKKKK